MVEDIPVLLLQWAIEENDWLLLSHNGLVNYVSREKTISLVNVVEVFLVFVYWEGGWDGC